MSPIISNAHSHTDIFISMTSLPMPIGPRQVSGLRRVTIPTRAAARVGVLPGSWVMVSAYRKDQGVLVIRPTGEPARGYGLRDPRRARKVSDTGQLTLPAALLDQVGIAVGEWVAFTTSRSGLRVFSANRVHGPKTTAS
jgi:bifunctional DNA-binding transcriptional regulator/antitoxin component of YhaV-PrlF toxin-antitoxin module